MRFLVITNAPTLAQGNKFVAYAPYVFEMDIWSQYVNHFSIISPTVYKGKLLVAPFKRQPHVISVSNLSFTSFYNGLKSIFLLPKIMLCIAKEMYKAEHIHLRCPGNISLLACLVQICFPRKTKTVKYAGNWDPKSRQPLSYRIQKWILSNTRLSKNIRVLVYGQWENQSKNIKSFFTASYAKKEAHKIENRDYGAHLKMVFIGSLVEGKRPLLALKIVESLNKLGKHISLDIYGDGVLRDNLQSYITNNGLDSSVNLLGNRSKDELKEALKKAHFSILPSKSEGWPKAIAEAMFFGTIPISTKVSCVDYMLDKGKRGILIEADEQLAVNTIIRYLEDHELLQEMSKLAAQWSQKYTLDYFESEIKKLLM